MQAASAETSRDGSEGGVRVVANRAGKSVVMTGEHDLATRERLRRALRRASDTGGDVLVDLTDVTFLDAGVLSELVGCESRLESNGDRLSVRTTATRIFELTCLVRLLETGLSSGIPE